MSSDSELFARMRVSLFDLIKLYYLTGIMSQFKGLFVYIYIFFIRNYLKPKIMYYP